MEPGGVDSRGCVDLNNVLPRDPGKLTSIWDDHVGDNKLIFLQQKSIQGVTSHERKVDLTAKVPKKTFWEKIRASSRRNWAKFRLYFLKPNKNSSTKELRQFLNCFRTAYENEIKPLLGKSFTDILKEKQGIDLLKFNDLEHRKLFKLALTDPAFCSVPLVISELGVFRDDISKDMQGHGSKIMFPDEVRDKYEKAETTEALAEAIEANKEYAKQIGSGTQKDIYGGELLEKDLERGRCDLHTVDKETGRTINIIIGNNSGLCGEENCLMPKDPETGKRSSFMDPNISKKEKLDAILAQIQQQSEKQGLILAEDEAFSILKQFVLGYRGQNGQVELTYCSHNMTYSETGQIFSFSQTQPENYMEFLKTEKSVNLTGIIDKVESGEIRLFSGDEYENHLEKASENYNFGFTYPEGVENPQEKDILSELGVKSTPIRNQDGQITGWECPFRENPPTHFILYGGATPAENPQNTL